MTNRTIGWGLLAAVGLACACQDGSDDDDRDPNVMVDSGGGVSGGPLPRVAMTFDPPHLQTGLDGRTVEPSVAAYPDSPLVSVFEFPDDVQLRTAAGETVPTMGKVDSSATNETMTYRLTPNSPLADGWYAVLLTPPPASYVRGAFAPEGPAGPEVRDDGSLASYFRVGSSPLLLSVAACASDEDGKFPKLLLKFSEAVELPDPSAVQLTQDGEPLSCMVYEASISGEPGFDMTCLPVPAAGTELVVSFSDGIVSSLSSAPLRDLDGNERIRVELPQVEHASDVCRTWRETRIPSE